MPVFDTHPEYDDNIAMWKKCRVALEGEDAVKAGSIVYLPKLSGQESSSYTAYLMRASFFTASYRTTKGLAGSVMGKPIKYEGVKDDDPTLETISKDGSNMDDLAKLTTEESIGIGKVGMLVDAAIDSEDPYVAMYTAENIINWRWSEINGKQLLTLVVLKEQYEEVDYDDPFKVDMKTQYRTLNLGNPQQIDEEGNIPLPPSPGETGLVYYQEVWREVEDATKKAESGWKVYETIYPTMRGGRSPDRIPFEIIEADDQKSPILDLVNINMSHYRNSADLEHGLHFTALPTAWMAGFPANQIWKIGSEVAWTTDDPQARAGYLEFTGAGLKSIREQMTEKEKLMAVLGARLLEQQTLDAEAAETVKLRHSGEACILGSIAGIVERGLQNVLRMIKLWEADIGDLEKITMSLNRDYNVISISPQMLVSLMQALQSSAISWNTFFYNLKKGEVIPPGVSEEDEKDRIESGDFAGLGTPQTPENTVEGQNANANAQGNQSTV